MGTMIIILIGCIGGLHLYFMYFEMFAWTKTGKKIFKNFPSSYFDDTKVLAANQGLYNGFLAVGMFWSLLISSQEWSKNVALFFLSCVAIAGIYGGMTASRKILYLQALPAIITIVLLVLVDQGVL